MTDRHQTFIYRFRWHDQLWNTAYVKTHGTTIVAAPGMLSHLVGRNLGDAIAELKAKHETLTVRATRLAVGT